MVSYSCDNPQVLHLIKVGGSFLGYAPRIPPSQTPDIHHSLCLPNIQTFFLKLSFTISIHLFFGWLTIWLPTYSHIHPFSNPIIPHSFNMAKSLDTFINSFIYLLYHCQFSLHAMNLKHCPSAQPFISLSNYHAVEQAWPMPHAPPLHAQGADS